MREHPQRYFPERWCVGECWVFSFLVLYKVVGREPWDLISLGQACRQV